MTSKYVSAILVVVACYVFASSCGANGRTQVRQKHYAYGFSTSSKEGWLGVEVEDVTKRLRERMNLPADVSGAYVRTVVEDSPAEKAGIVDGDVIIKFNDKSIDDSDDLIRAVKRVKPKTDVKIDVVRKGEKKTLTATIGKSPDMKEFSFNFNDRIPRVAPVPRIKPFHFEFFSSEELNGLRLEKLTKQLGEYFEAPGGKGLLVTQVKKGSVGEKAGFKAGDVIVKINDKTVRTIEEVHEEISDVDKGDVKIGIVRKGKALTLTMPVKNDDDEEDDDDYSMIAPIHQDPSCTVEKDVSQSTSEQMTSSVQPVAPVEYLQAKLLEGVQFLVHTFKELLLQS